MNKKQRDQQGRAIRWIDTRYARPYKARRAIRIASATAIQVQTLCQLNAIRSARGDGVQKSLAMAQAVANGAATLNAVLHDPDETCRPL